jgi:hypothetical protein
MANGANGVRLAVQRLARGLLIALQLAAVDAVKQTPPARAVTHAAPLMGRGCTGTGPCGAHPAGTVPGHERSTALRCVWVCVQAAPILPPSLAQLAVP